MSACRNGHVAEKDAAGRCKACRSARYRARYPALRGRILAKTKAWRATHVDWCKAYDRQYKGLPAATRPMPEHCENCGRHRGDRALNLDHDHVTGKFRGWLCAICNTGIGKLGDSIAGLLHAVEYLRRTQAPEPRNVNAETE